MLSTKHLKAGVTHSEVWTVFGVVSNIMKHHDAIWYSLRARTCRHFWINFENNMIQADAAWCSCRHNTGLRSKRSATNAQVDLELPKYFCVIQAEPNRYHIIILTDASELLVWSLERLKYPTVWLVLSHIFLQTKLHSIKQRYVLPRRFSSHGSWQLSFSPVKLTDFRKNYHNLTLRYIFQDGGFSSSNHAAQSDLDWAQIESSRSLRTQWLMYPLLCPQLCN